MFSRSIGQRRRMKRVEIVCREVINGPSFHSVPLYGGGLNEVSLFEVRERDPKLIAGAVDVGLHRAEGKVEDFGNLLVGAAFDMA